MTNQARWAPAPSVRRLWKWGTNKARPSILGFFHSKIREGILEVGTRVARKRTRGQVFYSRGDQGRNFSRQENANREHRVVINNNTLPWRLGESMIATRLFNSSEWMNECWAAAAAAAAGCKCIIAYRARHTHCNFDVIEPVAGRDLMPHMYISISCHLFHFTRV